ncbi:hypothetical protein AAHA92_03187 [Salvia divinorum]|uniref:Uncharacterized protein n=1 Tax=Salvia divinorum TaxID=28513 RepID=A0ABD1IIS3_SALDI
MHEIQKFSIKKNLMEMKGHQPEEHATNAAQELGLLLPKVLPRILQSADSEVPEPQNNTTETPQGVKVSAGMKCMFSQDVVAINVEKKLCCNLGELNKRAIATLDIDNMLQGMADL